MILKPKNALLIVGVASILYIYGLPFQLIYILLPVLFVLLLSIIVDTRLKKSIAIFFVFLIAYICISSFLQIYLSAQPGSIINFAICWLSIFVGYYLSKNINLVDMNYTIKRISWIAISYALVDAIWRFAHPNYEQIFDGNPFFYRYKNNSLMFEDSNFVGLMLVCLNGILFSTIKQFQELDRKLALMIFISVLLTFSRGSIFSVVFTYFLYFILNARLSLRVAMVIFIAVSSSTMFTLLYEDGSFRSKFFIIDLFDSYYQRLDIMSKLLGVGLGNTANFLGIGAHNIFVVGAFELGLLGSFLYILCCIALVFLAGQPMLYLIVPYFVNGFSLTSTSVPILFLFMGVLLSLREKQDSNREV
ncbi:hypothetical protein ACEUBS_19340 [Aeromonas veronii]|uniref:hypothetical protein n=1 Tax=Aeromonas veronii TaxID=654 RepID=UPI0038D3016D